MVVPNDYKGREQTFIKHTLLQQYLEKLFMIKGQFDENICYVDCFAGPWQEGSDDLNDTSISISLEIIKKCQEGLSLRGKAVQFRALYIEKDRNSFHKLQDFINEDRWKNIQTYSLNGSFFDLREEICEWCGDTDFTFFFVDPTGWKNVIEPNTLMPLLKRNRSELLINFMLDFIRRTHTQKPFEDDMIKIFGDIPDTEGMTPLEREESFIAAYANRLKQYQNLKQNKQRTANVRVYYPYKDQTMYHLVYLTRHPRGIVEFMKISEKLDIIQDKVRAHVKQNLRIQKTGQMEIFEPDCMSDTKLDPIDLSEVKQYWLNKITSEHEFFGINELADMLEETGWFIKHFQKAFKELEKENKVVNLDARGNRPVKPVHFDAQSGKGERLRKL